MKSSYLIKIPIWVAIASCLPLFQQTASAQTNCSAPVSGLVGWWRAEGNALDETATNNGVASVNVAYASAKVGQGFVFDGSGAVVALNNPANLHLQNLTIEGWIRRSSSAVVSLNGNGNAHILSYGDDGYGL